MMYNYFSNPDECCTRNPGNLKSLAMEAIGRHIKYLLKKLVKRNQMSLTNETCIHLQNKLHRSVRISPALSNEMKIRILRHFEDTYKELVGKYSKKSHFEEIAKEVFIAIINPEAKQVKCFGTTSHPTVLDPYKMVFSDLIFNSLPRLKDLEILLLGEAVMISKPKEALHHFVKFPANSKDPNSGISIHKYCNKLRVLGVNRDFFEFSGSISVILMFDHLQELKIPNVNLVDVTYLLKGLSAKKRNDGSYLSENIKKLICNANLSSDVIELLGNTFKNMVSLSLVCKSESLTPLQTMTHLRRFNVDTDSFMQVKDLLSELGNNIACLSLRITSDLDFRFIALECPFVVCIHLKCDEVMNWFSDIANISSKRSLNYSIPEFPFVESVHFEFSFDHKEIIIENLFKIFPHVRKLFLSNCNSNVLFNSVIRRNTLRFLETAFFKWHSNLLVIDFEDNCAVITESIRDNTQEVPSITVRSLPIG